MPTQCPVEIKNVSLSVIKEVVIKKYRVILTSRSSLKAKGRRIWKSPEYMISIQDDLQKVKDYEPLQHEGLIYTVEIMSDHIVNSIHSAITHVRHVTDQLSVLHGVEIEYPRARFAIDIDPTSKDRELAQVLWNVPIFYQPRRSYDHKFYKTFHDNLDKLRSINEKDARRIDRALHYLRSSYAEEEPIDKFQDAWVALESINPLIRSKFNLPTTRSPKCPSCGSALKPVPDDWSGIRHIVTNLLGEQLEKAKRLRDKRVEIEHATVSLVDMLQDLPDLTSLAQRAVLMGVLEVLEIIAEDRSKILCDVLPIFGPPVLIVTGKTFDFPLEILSKYDKYPQLCLKSCQILKPNREESHMGESQPHAVQLEICIQNYSGEWNLNREVWPLGSRKLTTEVYAIKIG